jgi:hypothetical protein
VSAELHRSIASVAAVALTGLIADGVLAQGWRHEAFVDIDQTDRSSIRVREVSVDPPVVRGPELLLDRASVRVSPDASLDRPLARLGLDGVGLRSAASLLAADLANAGSPLIEFSVAGNPVRMALIEVRADDDFDALHLTLVATDSDDYARLTIARDGTEVVGTVIVGDDEFRILPETATSQLVYPVVVFKEQFRRERLPDLGTRGGRLQQRHLQMAWYASEAPSSFSTEPDGRPSAYESVTGLGILDFWHALTVGADGRVSVDEAAIEREVERFLNGLAHYTWIDETIDVQIDRVYAGTLPEVNSNGLTIDGRQLINGYPLSLEFHLYPGANGLVTRLHGHLMRTSFAEPASEPISLDTARRVAESALREEYGIVGIKRFGDERLINQVVARNDIDLIWHIGFLDECDRSFFARINALSGEPIAVVPTFFPENLAVEEWLARCVSVPSR